MTPSLSNHTPAPDNPIFDAVFTSPPTPPPDATSNNPNFPAGTNIALFVFVRSVIPCLTINQPLKVSYSLYGFINTASCNADFADAKSSYTT